MSRLDEARRMLDGPANGGGILESVSQSLSEIVDSAKSVFDGVSKEEAQSGEVDRSALTRGERAQLALDGEISGFFGHNPWGDGPVFQFDGSLADFVHAHGGGVVVLSIDASQFDVAESLAIAPRFGILWDDEIVASSGVLDLKVTSKTFLVAQLKDQPLGTSLSFWCTDNDVIVTPIRQGTPQEADAIRKEVFGAVGAASDNPLSEVLATIQGIFDAQALGVLALVVGVGVVAYILVKNDAFKMNVVV